MDLETISIRYGISKDKLIKKSDGRILWCCDHNVLHVIWFPETLTKSHDCCVNLCCKKINGGY